LDPMSEELPPAGPIEIDLPCQATGDDTVKAVLDHLLHTNPLFAQAWKYAKQTFGIQLTARQSSERSSGYERTGGGWSLWIDPTLTSAQIAKELYKIIVRIVEQTAVNELCTKMRGKIDREEFALNDIAIQFEAERLAYKLGCRANPPTWKETENLVDSHRKWWDLNHSEIYLKKHLQNSLKKFGPIEKSQTVQSQRR
jgi:hypothetical protein